MRDHLGVFNVSSDLKFAKGILLLDDCEGTFTWSFTGTDANAAASFAAAAAFMGTNGMLATTGDDSPAEDDTLQIVKYVEVPESGLVVFRVKFGLPDVSIVKGVNVLINIHRDSKVYAAGLLYLPDTPGGYYLGDDGGYHEVAAWANAVPDHAWQMAEIVVDINDLKYISGLLNGVPADLSAMAVYDGGVSAGRFMTIGLNVTAAGAAAAIVYFDNIYVGEFLHI